jgi:broad specificity phosphatase PhoE
VPRLLLLRHAAVSGRHTGLCYGRTDVALGAAGLTQTRALAAALAGESFDTIFASPARRARLLALRVGARLGRPVRIEARLAERDFGSWEGCSWDEIWATTGDAMNGMIDAPDSYRPGGGETTAELAARVLDWFQGLAPDAAAVAVAHGGPIAALVGTLLREPARHWLRHLPAPGCGLCVEAKGPEWQVKPWRPPEPGADDGG